MRTSGEDRPKWHPVTGGEHHRGPGRRVPGAVGRAAEVADGYLGPGPAVERLGASARRGGEGHPMEAQVGSSSQGNSAARRPGWLP
jgi:hypothetical protein